MIILCIIALVAIAILAGTLGSIKEDYEIKEAGREGERAATGVIKKILRDEDILLTNVKITYDGRDAELDNVVINKYGVFIIEVKSYVGILYGNEDDYTWTKQKIDGYGNCFTKEVRNPIKQVKRQVYLLANYLDYWGIRVWVEGYAYLIEENSPVRCYEVLEDVSAIDKAIHTFNKNRLSTSTVKEIQEILRS